MDDLRDRLSAIERALDAGTYRPGEWSAFLTAARRAPRRVRRALTRDVSRVSSKLHRRRARPTCSPALACTIEIAATAAGGALLWLGSSASRGAAAMAGLLVWITTFEPLVKVTVGSMLGVRYDHAYVAGIEPRFKMRYGTYLAAPAPARILLQLSGCVGSPLAATVVDRLVPARLSHVHRSARILFGILVAVNAGLFLGALSGVRRVGPLRLSASSGGAAGAELREMLTSSA